MTAAVCAWCPGFDPKAETSRGVSHGICPDCLTRVLAAEEIVADVCLYGTNRIGAGWLAATKDGLNYGTGDPVQHRTFTEAIWLAVDAIHKTSGLVRVFHPGGRTMSILNLAQPVPTYGTLLAAGVQAAPVLVFSVAEIIAASESQVH